MRSGIDHGLAGAGLILCAGLIVSGCGTGSQADPTKLVRPLERYMEKKRPIPATPPGAAMNPAANNHLADVRAVCVARGRKIDGLQSWVNIVAPLKAKQ